MQKKSHHVSRLRSALSAISDLSEEAWIALEPNWEYKELKRGDYLHKVGEPATQIAFVLEGALREYFLTYEGQEFNKAFVFSDEFSGSLLDLISEDVSTASVQAIKPCKLMVTPYQSMTDLYDQFECLQRMGRVIIEGLFIKKARREYEFLTMDAPSRYQLLVKQNPRFVKELPKYHLASYLGITPEGLSRIRANLK